MRGDEVPILVVDQFLNPRDFAQIGPELASFRAWKKEIDREGATPVGETCEVPPNSLIWRAMSEELKKLFPVNWRIDRFYVNRFQAKDVPQFHEDGEVLTCLLYADPQDWHPDDHGETQLLINGEIRGVIPVPNRMLVFDGRLLHRATSFQTRRRHTVAAKLEGASFADVVMPT